MAEETKTNSAPAKAVTAVKKDETKLTFWQKIGKWFREMKSELKKVIWPTEQWQRRRNGMSFIPIPGMKMQLPLR